MSAHYLQEPTCTMIVLVPLIRILEGTPSAFSIWIHPPAAADDEVSHSVVVPEPSTITSAFVCHGVVVPTVSKFAIVVVAIVEVAATLNVLSNSTAPSTPSSSASTVARMSNVLPVPIRKNVKYAFAVVESVTASPSVTEPFAFNVPSVAMLPFDAVVVAYPFTMKLPVCEVMELDAAPVTVNAPTTVEDA